jgi:non-specific serine/threonine protein kinase
LDDDNVAAVVEICRKVDGLPLAIELAAARVKFLPPPALLARLDHRMTLLTGGARDLPERQQTLRATLAWSYGLLSPDEQWLFTRLSIFPGGFDLESAAAAAGDRPELDAMSGVASLLDKSLLIRVLDVAGFARFRMLETVREYGLERLAEEGAVDSVMGRLLEWYSTAFDAFAQVVLAPWPWRQEWMTRFGLEIDNLRLVLDWGLTRAPAARFLAGQVAGYLLFRSSFSEGEQLVERALAASDGDPVDSTVMLLVSGAWFALWRSEFARGLQLLDRADALVDDGTPFSRGDALAARGVIELRLGRFDRAEATLVQAIAWAEAEGSERSVAQMLVYLAATVYRSGDLERAGRLYEEALTRTRAVGNSIGVMHSLLGLGRVARRMGDYQRSQALFVESARLFHEIGDRVNCAGCLRRLASIAASHDQLQTAAVLLSVADALEEATGFVPMPSSREWREREVADVHERMADDAFAAAWAAGRVMTAPEAIDLAANIDLTPSTHCPTAPADDFGLSPRELDVVKLVAEGRSNAEIAETLFISPRTVTTHMTNIYNKLDVNTRAGVVSLYLKGRPG